MPPETSSAQGPVQEGPSWQAAPHGSEPPGTPTLALVVLWSLLMVSPLSRALGPSPSLSLPWLLYLPACSPHDPLFLPSCIHVTLSHSDYGKSRVS